MRDLQREGCCVTKQNQPVPDSWAFKPPGISFSTPQVERFYKMHFIGWAGWLTPVIPTLWEAEVGGSPEVGSSRAANQHRETVSLLKIQN